MFGYRKFRSKKALARYRRVLLLRAVLLLVAIGLLIGALSAISRFPFLTLNTITVEGIASTESQAFIIALAQQQLEGSYVFGLFPKTNTLLYPRRTIEENILQDMPQLHSVHAEVSSFTTLRIRVDKRQEAAMWCGYTPESPLTIGTADTTADATATGTTPVFVSPYLLTANHSCYFIDETGYIFISAEDSPPNTLMRYYAPIAEGPPMGQTLTDKKTFDTLQQLVKIIADAEVPLTGVALEGGGDGVMLFRSGMRVRFTLTDTPEAIVTRLQSVLSSDAFKKTPLSSIDYIDLRFGNRAYFKLYE